MQTKTKNQLTIICVPGATEAELKNLFQTVKRAIDDGAMYPLVVNGKVQVYQIEGGKVFEVVSSLKEIKQRTTKVNSNGRRKTN